jgi:hypothetical protein
MVNTSATAADWWSSSQSINREATGFGGCDKPFGHGVRVGLVLQIAAGEKIKRHVHIACHGRWKKEAETRKQRTE